MSTISIIHIIDIFPNFKGQKSIELPSVIRTNKPPKRKNKLSMKSMEYVDGAKDGVYNIPLKNYKLTAYMKLEADTKSSFYPNAKFRLSYIDGRKEYFDGEGYLLAIEDKFGNCIKFEKGLSHLEYDINLNTSYEIYNIVITDTSGRKVYVNYSYTSNYSLNPDFNTHRQIQIILPDGNTIRYTIEFRSYTTWLDYMTCLPNPPTVWVYDVISCRDDSSEGGHTEYKYDNYLNYFNYFSKNPSSSPGTALSYFYLSEVEYPTGGKTNYGYTAMTGNLGKLGSFNYEALFSRKDYDGTTYCNEELYVYGNNYTGTLSTSTSPDDLPESYEYTTTVHDATRKLQTVYIFNGKHLRKSREIFSISSATTSLQRTDCTYDTYNLPKVITHNVYYGTPKVTQTTTESFEYSNDAKGNLLKYTNAQGNLYTYTYDTSAGNYNMLTKMTYRKDSGTTITETYTLSSDKKTLKEKQITEGGALKSKTSYDYDVSGYGNMIKMIDYYEASKSVVTEYEYNTYSMISKKTIGGVPEKFEYNYMDRLTKYTDGKGNSTGYSYDNIGRPRSTTNPDGTSVTYSYVVDSYANINSVTVTNEIGTKLIYNYDKLGRLKNIYDVAGYVYLKECEYDNTC